MPRSRRCCANEWQRFIRFYLRVHSSEVVVAQQLSHVVVAEHHAKIAAAAALFLPSRDPACPDSHRGLQGSVHALETRCSGILLGLSPASGHVQHRQLGRGQLLGAAEEALPQHASRLLHLALDAGRSTSQHFRPHQATMGGGGGEA